MKQRKTCAWCGNEFTAFRSTARCCSIYCRNMRLYHNGLSRAEWEKRKQAKRDEDARLELEKKLKVRVNVLTEKQMQAVIDAQDGDPSQLYRLSQSWTPEQHKYAKARYGCIHGLFSNTFRC